MRVVVRVKQTVFHEITTRLMKFSFSTNLYVPRINISVVFKLQMAEFVIFATICKVVSGLLQLTTFFLFLFFNSLALQDASLYIEDVNVSGINHKFTGC